MDFLGLGQYVIFVVDVGGEDLLVVFVEVEVVFGVGMVEVFVQGCFDYLDVMQFVVQQVGIDEVVFEDVVIGEVFLVYCVVVVRYQYFVFVE